MAILTLQQLTGIFNRNQHVIRVLAIVPNPRERQHLLTSVHLFISDQNAIYQIFFTNQIDQLTIEKIDAQKVLNICEKHPEWLLEDIEIGCLQDTSGNCHKISIKDNRLKNFLAHFSTRICQNYLNESNETKKRLLISAYWLLNPNSIHKPLTVS